MRETSSEKKKIGMVVAVEIDAVLTHLGEPVETASYGSLPVRVYDLECAFLYVAHSGAGEIGADAEDGGGNEADHKDQRKQDRGQFLHIRFLLDIFV